MPVPRFISAVRDELRGIQRASSGPARSWEQNGDHWVQREVERASSRRGAPARSWVENGGTWVQEAPPPMLSAAPRRWAMVAGEWVRLEEGQEAPTRNGSRNAHDAAAAEPRAQEAEVV